MANGDGRNFASQNTVQDMAGQTGAAWQARQQAQRDVADEFETIDDPDEVNLERRDDGLAPSQEFLDIAEPREAAYDIDRQMPDHDIGPGDVERADDGTGFGLTTDAQAGIVRQNVAEGVDRIDVDPQQDVAVQYDNGEVTGGELTGEAQTRIAIDEVESEYGIDAEQSDFTIGEDGPRMGSDLEGEIEQELQEEAEWEAKLEADAAFTAATGIEAQPDDFRIVADDIRPDPEIQQQWEDQVEEQAREQAAENLSEEYDADFQPEDFEYYQGAAHLSEDVRAEFDAGQLSQEYQADIEPQDISYDASGELEVDQSAQAQIDAQSLSEEFQTDIGPQDLEYDAGGEVRLEDPASLGIDPAAEGQLSPAEQAEREREDDELEFEDPQLEGSGEVTGPGGYEPPSDSDELPGTQQTSVETQPELAAFEDEGEGESLTSQVGSAFGDLGEQASAGVSSFIDEPYETTQDIGGEIQTAIDDPGGTVEDVGTDALVGGVEAAEVGGEAVLDAEVDTDLATDLSRGGVLSETPEDTSGLLPGEFAGMDISEERLRGAAEWGEETRAGFDENPDVEGVVTGSDAPERVLQGAAGAGVGILNVPQHVLTAEGVAEGAQGTPGAISEYGVGTYAESAGAAGRDVTTGAAGAAAESPIEFGSGLAFGFATGAAAGRATGQIGRVAGDRVRTAGATRIEPDELASESVLRNIETEGAEGDRFPGAADTDLYESDPAAAVREQADEYTPSAVDELFSEQGVEGGTTLTKALDVEPEGPGAGRADTGFTSAPDEVGGDFEYETPGSFFGPELSPNFLRTDAGEASFSFRPGLPDLGNRPTGVLARTDVENPEAETLPGLNREIMDRTGESTAVTKPADEVNPGEIEAIVPPGGEFEPVRGGGLGTDLARRAGIGADFYTEVGGRRVPLRTVAGADMAPDADVEADAGAGGGLFGDADAGGESLEYYARAPGDPVDRPLPSSVPGAGEPMGVESDPMDEPAAESFDSTPSERGAPADAEVFSPMGYDGIESDVESRPAESGYESGGVFGESMGATPASRDRAAPSRGESGAPPGVTSTPGGGYPSEGIPGESPGPGYSPLGDSPFGGPAPTTPPGESQPTRPRTRIDPEDELEEDPWPEAEPVDPVSPEYINPVASGTSNIFGDDLAGEFDEDLGGDSATADAADNLFGGEW